jgi:hypothetical protein
VVEKCQAIIAANQNLTMRAHAQRWVLSFGACALIPENVSACAVIDLRMRDYLSIFIKENVRSKFKQSRVLGKYNETKFFYDLSNLSSREAETPRRGQIYSIFIILQ